MGVTVNANMMSVVHAGSSGISPSFPDACKTPTPGGPVPIPYPNIAQSSDTDKGSETVKIDKKKVMLKSSVFKMSAGDEAGSAQGVVSNKIKGKAEFVNYSFDVKIDGKNVVRLLDPATTNQGSTANTASPAIGQAPVIGMSKHPEECKKTKAKEEEQQGDGTSWGKSGIHPRHKPKIQEAATEEKCVLYFRATNTDCEPWIGAAHQPKPHSVLAAKTIGGANQNECQDWLDGKTGDPGRDKWLKGRTDIMSPPLGTSYKVYSSNAGHFRGVVMKKLEGPQNGMPMVGFGCDFAGKKSYKRKWITGDYDLMDVILAGGKCNRPDQKGADFGRIQKTVNAKCRWDAIQHGPQSQYAEKDIPRQMLNYLNSNDTTPPKVKLTEKRQMTVLDNELTVVAPEGRVVTLETDEDVKAGLLCAGCANPE